MLSKFDINKLNELPIESVASALGLTVSHHKSLCPFHNDSHPSLTYHRGKNRYKCYVCDAHGGVIDLVMNYLHKDFLSACRWLSSMDPSTLILQHPSSLIPKPSADRTLHSPRVRTLCYCREVPHQQHRSISVDSCFTTVVSRGAGTFTQLRRSANYHLIGL